MKWIRWTLTVVAPVVGVLAGLLQPRWRDDVFNAFPFAIRAGGPIAWRALVLWALLLVPITAVARRTMLERRAKREKASKRQRILTGHARAVALTVSRTRGDTAIWVTNRSTRVIADVTVNAVPDDERAPLPPELEPTEAPGVTVLPMLGAWFNAKVARLSPGIGQRIGTARFSDRDFSRIDFDISWIDHEGRRRKSHAVADLREVSYDISTVPRPDGARLG